MTRVPFLAAAALLVGLAACRNEPLAFEQPEWPNGGHLGGTAPLDSAEKAALEGVYAVDAGKETFGDTVVLKWSGNYLTVFTGKDVKYMMTQAGNTGTLIYIEGYWRAQNSTSAGLVQFTYPSGGPASPLNGVFGNNSDDPTQALTLRFLRAINPSQLTNTFWNISHHLSGGAPLVLPHSENSIEMLKEIERYGANGVEIDVRPTKDGIPILYHDSGLNWRLTQKGPLVGPVEDYNLDQIEASVRLLHGEKIPTLEAFLDTLIIQTKLEFVYVDMKKTSVDAMPAILSVIEAARTKAQGIPGRNVIILPALTTDEVFASFASQPGFPNIPSMCELTIDQVHQANSEVWSPRFTSGFTKEEVDQLHGEGRKVVSWTVNVPSLIEDYMFTVKLDGLDSDYNTLVAWYWYKH